MHGAAAVREMALRQTFLLGCFEAIYIVYGLHDNGVQIVKHRDNAGLRCAK